MCALCEQPLATTGHHKLMGVLYGKPVCMPCARTIWIEYTKTLDKTKEAV